MTIPPGGTLLALPLLLALQSGQSGPPRDLNDLDNSYCIETGTCRAEETGFNRPAPGILFAAIGLTGLGVVLWRADRSRRSEENAPSD